MRPLPAYLRENFKSFLSGAFRIKFFLFEDIVNIRNECLIFLRSWKMNLAEAVTNLPRNASRFMGFVTCLTIVHFPMNAEIKTLIPEIIPLIITFARLFHLITFWIRIKEA